MIAPNGARNGTKIVTPFTSMGPHSEFYRAWHLPVFAILGQSDLRVRDSIRGLSIDGYFWCVDVATRPYLQTFQPIKSVDQMTTLDDLNLAAALAELEKLVTSQVVVGDPVEIGDHTIIPLCSVGFGMGAGRGGGSQSTTDKGDQTGGGGGLGFGGGVRPIAVIISGPDGVRVDSVGMSDWIDWANIRELILGRKPEDMQKAE